MDGQDLGNLEIVSNVRIFPDMRGKIERIVRYAKDSDTGDRKYDNVSHFVRCACLQLIHKERKQLNDRGRPKK